MLTPSAEFVSNFEVRVYFNGRIWRIVKCLTTKEWRVTTLRSKEILFSSDNPEDGLAWIYENCGNCV